MQMQLRLLRRICCQRLRNWSLNVWLWMVCACMHARAALIGAKLYRAIKDMGVLTLVRSRSDVVCARMLLAELGI